MEGLKLWYDVNEKKYNFNRGRQSCCSYKFFQQELQET